MRLTLCAVTETDPSVRDSTLNLLERGLTHIRKRRSLYPRDLSTGGSNHSAGAADIDDLRLLYRARSGSEEH